MQEMATALQGLNAAFTWKSPASDEANKSQNRNPEVFDGLDPQKLQSFLVSLSLVFSECPQYFATDERKISYTLLYFSSVACKWFEPDLINPDPIDPPAWMLYYSSLVEELVENFGAHNVETNAKEKLSELHMRDTNQVKKYMTQFNALAANITWDE